MRDTVWSSQEQAEHAVAVARDTKRRPNEGYLDYIERLAVLSGFITPEKCMRLDPEQTKWTDPPEPRRRDDEEPNRLPYRDSD